MKNLLPILAVLSLVSCEREAPEAERSTKHKLEMIGADIGGAEHSLESEKDAGKTALLVERLRDAKMELGVAITNRPSNLSESEAKEIAEASRKAAIAHLKKAQSKNRGEQVVGNGEAPQP